MTTSDTATLIRSLDPAARDVDVHHPRVQAALEQIVATGPVPRRPPGSGRRRLRLAVAAGGAVAAVTAAVVLLPSVTGGDRAFATWTASPDALSAAEGAEAAEGCRAAQSDGPDGYDADLRAARPAIAERRGVWTTVMLAGPDGFSALCITDGSTRLFGDWFGSIGRAEAAAAPSPRAVVATDLGVGALEAGELSVAAGAAGPDVSGMVLHSRTHGDVTATVSSGRFALWMPGDELENAPRAGVRVELTFRDGSTRVVRLRL